LALVVLVVRLVQVELLVGLHILELLQLITSLLLAVDVVERVLQVRPIH
jgi:hypothetical protein